MPATSHDKDPAQQARFVFKGTVKKLKAATMSSVPINEGTVVVRVDEVLHAPELLSKYAGKDITVQLTGRKKVKKGQQAVFYTAGWLFGESVAVQSLDHHPVERTPATLRLHADPVRNLAARDVETRIESADVVVSGKVVSVHVPTESTGSSPGAREAATEPTRPLRPSEHDPMWQEAVIEIKDVHKGVHSAKNIVVRFPSSRDIMWRKAPKFHAGQEGIFILHREGAVEREAERAAARPAVQAETYTALNPADFHPTARVDTVRRLLGLSDSPESS